MQSAIQPSFRHPHPRIRRELVEMLYTSMPQVAAISLTSLIGGVGTISGTAIGAFVIGILRNGLNMNGVSAFTQQIIIGLVILMTVWIDQLRNRR